MAKLAAVVVAVLVALLVASAAATYVTTCGSISNCGTVCGWTLDNDIVAPSEGLFGTSCTCGGDGSMTQVCTYDGIYAVSECNAGPPGCSTACNQQICIAMNGQQATGTIMSACPKHHPTNVQQCCAYQNDAYCTCIIQDTLDIATQPYDQLGGANGWSSGATWGACGSELGKLNIQISSERATKLVQPFLVNGTWCKANAQPTPVLVATAATCKAISDPTTCAATAGCTFCKSGAPLVSTQCYATREAVVLAHVLAEEHLGTFVCV
jgi:hypothetical protein